MRVSRIWRVAGGGDYWRVFGSVKPKESVLQAKFDDGIVASPMSTTTEQPVKEEYAAHRKFVGPPEKSMIWPAPGSSAY